MKSKPLLSDKILTVMASFKIPPTTPKRTAPPVKAESYADRECQPVKQLMHNSWGSFIHQGRTSTGEFAAYWDMKNKFGAKVDIKNNSRITAEEICADSLVRTKFEDLAGNRKHDLESMRETYRNFPGSYDTQEKIEKIKQFGLLDDKRTVDTLAEIIGSYAESYQVKQSAAIMLGCKYEQSEYAAGVLLNALPEDGRIPANREGGMSSDKFNFYTNIFWALGALQCPDGSPIKARVTHKIADVLSSTISRSIDAYGNFYPAAVIALCKLGCPSDTDPAEYIDYFKRIMFTLCKSKNVTITSDELLGGRIREKGSGYENVNPYWEIKDSDTLPAIKPEFSEVINNFFVSLKTSRLYKHQ